MSNITTFGIEKIDISRYLNPSLSLGADAFTFEDIESGTATSYSGTGALTVWTVTGKNWKLNVWQGWSLKIGTTLYTIASNTASTITVVTGTLTGLSGAWSITTTSFNLSDTLFTAYLTKAVSLVKSDIPERYRRMIDKMRGEIIIERAYYGQTSASLTYASSVANSLVIWNKRYCGDISDRYRSEAYDLTTDYTVGVDNKTITFLSQLSEDDCIIADYEHALDSVPEQLKYLAVLKTVIIIVSQLYFAPESSPVNIEKLTAEYKAIIDGLNKGLIGISEFDNIKLVSETKGDVGGAGLYGSYENLI